MHLIMQDGFQSARDTYTTAAGMQALMLSDTPKRRLSSLSVAGCCQISGKGLQALTRACSKSMRQLNISRTAVASLQLITKWVGRYPLTYPLCNLVQALGNVIKILTEGCKSVSECNVADL